ncbi:MAG: DUF1648 domain-containing protein [Gammaproteobacteria bacterium]|nr:DUF1648 domain-containing protein [Gammaproteobacteria bacterium]
MIWLRNFFLFLLVLTAIQIAYYYPQMPEVLASHFDINGKPNGWASKQGFFTLYGVIVIMVGAIFLFLPRWSEKRSSFARKIPNKIFWLAPERIEQTLLFLRCHMLVMGIVHLVLAVLVMQLAINANLAVSPVLNDKIFWIISGYFGCLAVWLLYYFHHFRNPL